MVTFEDFIVQVPRTSKLLVDDLVETKDIITLRKGFILGKGWVISIDEEEDTDLSPVFFVEGLQTGVRSPLRLDMLFKSGRLLAKL